MTKAEQYQINARVMSNMHNMNASRAAHVCGVEHQLRTCQAWVGHVNGYYYLRSYRTIIACIDDDGVCYDFLRYAYGYTATSAQHISKFISEYGDGTHYKYYPIAEE